MATLAINTRRGLTVLIGGLLAVALLLPIPARAIDSVQVIGDVRALVAAGREFKIVIDSRTEKTIVGPINQSHRDLATNNGIPEDRYIPGLIKPNNAAGSWTIELAAKFPQWKKEEHVQRYFSRLQAHPEGQHLLNSGTLPNLAVTVNQRRMAIKSNVQPAPAQAPQPASAGISDPLRVKGLMCKDMGDSWEGIFEKRLRRLNLPYAKQVRVRLSDGQVRDYDLLIHLGGDDYWAIENTIASSLKDKQKDQIPKDTKAVAARPSGILNGRSIYVRGVTYILMITPSKNWQAKFNAQGLTWVNLTNSDRIKNNNFSALLPGREPPLRLSVTELFAPQRIPVIGALPKGFDVRRVRIKMEDALAPSIQKGQIKADAANQLLSTLISVLSTYLKGQSDAAIAERVWEGIAREIGTLTQTVPEGQTVWLRITLGGPGACVQDAVGADIPLPAEWGSYTLETGNVQALGLAEQCQLGMMRAVEMPPAESTISPLAVRKHPDTGAEMFAPYIYQKFDLCVAGSGMQSGTQDGVIWVLKGPFFSSNGRCLPDEEPSPDIKKCGPQDKQAQISGTRMTLTSDRTGRTNWLEWKVKAPATLKAGDEIKLTLTASRDYEGPVVGGWWNIEGESEGEGDTSAGSAKDYRLSGSPDPHSATYTFKFDPGFGDPYVQLSAGNDFSPELWVLVTYKFEEQPAE